MRLTIVVWLLLASACGRRPLPDGVERVPLRTDADGLSGLAVHADGTLWAIAESAGPLVRIDGARGVTVPLEGVPEGLDTESIAWLDRERVAIGTESMDAARDGDVILVARVEGERARVIDRVRLPYSLLGASGEENHGVEALCAAGGRLFAVLENVRVVEGRRRAPLAVYDLGAQRWEAREVALTSETGKIAGLACRARGGVIEAHAIERHFGVARVVRFAIDPSSRGVLSPAVVRDLDGLLDGDPNPRGIEHDEDALVLVIDNHYGRRTGPNELVRVRLP
ncbi:MAG: esterase-like activity of phytase family protein [Sandaracinaceae bacterium]|nr:esterase-like activity of phytase family protein [Sandaracinaceae bacterium]